MLEIYNLLCAKKRLMILGGKKPINQYSHHELDNLDTNARKSLGKIIFLSIKDKNLGDKYMKLGRQTLSYKIYNLFDLYKKSKTTQKAEEIKSEAEEINNYFIMRYGVCPLKEYKELYQSDTEEYIKNE